MGKNERNICNKYTRVRDITRNEYNHTCKGKKLKKHAAHTNLIWLRIHILRRGIEPGIVRIRRLRRDLVRRPELHVVREQVVADAVGRLAQDLAAARVVEEDLRLREGREVCAHAGDVERGHGGLCSEGLTMYDENRCW